MYSRDERGTAARYRRLLHILEDAGVDTGAAREVRRGYADAAEGLRVLDTALIVADMVAPDPSMLIAVLTAPPVLAGTLTADDVAARWGDDAASLVAGRVKIAGLYEHRSAVRDDNFAGLLLALARDIRVIIITAADRLALMRSLNHHPDATLVREVSAEAIYLYAPLVHRLGLYKIKSELEDLWLKYTNREIYTRIARGLNEKKGERDRYIAQFIAPLRQALEEAGLSFEIKGRTKSIHSIWNKLRKQQIDLASVYDLYAIRIIVDAEGKREKEDCWRAYSVVADMYTPNPARFKDWITIPKSNGYESLHTTVSGPEGKWVEVQIRSRRMNLVAEKGLAAHWRYKGIRSDDSGMDAWMNNVRDILEAGADAGAAELRKSAMGSERESEVFVFTPKGDLYKLPAGATLLDFAFAIHTKVGATCVGGTVNGRPRKLAHKLSSGDTVEITTSAQQQPRRQWLDIVVTSRARNKIRQQLNEQLRREADLGRETLERRARNRKTELDEGILSRLLKQLGYKTLTEFYAAIGRSDLDAADILQQYDEAVALADAPDERVSAENFVLQSAPESDTRERDTIIIGDGVKGVHYRLARCCNPIQGEEVFGFIASDGAISIHRADCPNALHMRQRYPYRETPVQWGNARGMLFTATLAIVGTDDISIVTNITSLVAKEPGVALRSISIDSHDGLFRGFMAVGVSEAQALTHLVKKIRTIKGVKNVSRTN